MAGMDRAHGTRASIGLCTMEVIDNGIGGVPMLPGQISIEEQIASVSGDGACDTRACSP